jgi:hypothetical protein
MALVMAVVTLCTLAPVAQARDFDRYETYRSTRYYRGRDGSEVRRREIVRSRMMDLADRARLAARQGDLSRREVDRIYDRLDDVRDFLRGDRYLTESEFRRRMDDLDDVSRDLRDYRGGPRYRDDYRWRRDRYDDRYRY